MPDSSTFTETEDRIFRSALKVFAQKGREGARMQEIADDAGINKAMLHYYFRSKERLYEEVFGYVLRRLTRMFDPLYGEAGRFEDVLRGFVNAYVDLVNQNQDVVRVMVSEMLAGGPVLKARLGPLLEVGGLSPPRFLLDRMVEAMERGEIRRVDPLQTLVSIVAACVFVFIAFPIVSAVEPALLARRDEFIEARKQHVFDLIYNGLRATPNEAT
jgi:TetR/AcrR family transcriptional regulator